MEKYTHRNRYRTLMDIRRKLLERHTNLVVRPIYQLGGCKMNMPILHTLIFCTKQFSFDLRFIVFV